MNEEQIEEAEFLISQPQASPDDVRRVAKALLDALKDERKYSSRLLTEAIRVQRFLDRVQGLP